MLTMQWWTIPAILFGVLVAACLFISKQDFIASGLLAAAVFMFGGVALIVLSALCYAIAG